MKVEKLDHIHIYVENLEKAKELFGRLLRTSFSPDIVVDELKIRTSFSPFGIELIEPTSPDSVVAKAMEKGGEGLYGLSFKVDDLEQAIAELQAEGCRLVGRVEVGGIKEAQFHPKDTCGVMIELCQYEELHGAAQAALRNKDKMSIS